jgi:hypothetical protein
LAKAGDWTSIVHKRIDKCDATARPIWVTGPVRISFFPLQHR